jgi:glycosyltransferase involved in cell wall biosynthesis
VLVTVGLGVFNGERWVERAIESILAQTYSNFELLISDNCSTDRTHEICERYAARDKRIRLTRTATNVGAAENFNVMCRLATGKYFKYASCNDYCEPDLLRRCIEVLEARSDVAVCHPRARLLIEETGRSEEYEHKLHLMSDSPFERLRTYFETVRLNNVEQGLLRVEWLRRTPLQEPFIGSDISLMAELSVYGKFYEIPEFLFVRRVGEKAMSSLRGDQELASFYAPGQKALLWQEWKRMLALSRMAFRVPLSNPERVKLLRYVGRQWRFSRRQLLGDIRQSIAYSSSSFGRASRSAGG